MSGINLNGIDNRISEITREVDFYSYLTPLNQKEEEEKFFSFLKKGEAYNPAFHYKEASYFYQEKWLKNALASLDKNDRMHTLFIKKIVFLIKQLELLGSDDIHLTRLAVELYGRPDRNCLCLAEKILTESKDEGYVFPKETIIPEEMASILRKRLKDRDIDWEVVLSKKIVPKITVSAKDKTVYINESINYTASEIERLKIHEVVVHIYRGVNGGEQPFKIFKEGLAGYDETEEGLAILAEERAGVLETDTRQMKLYAGRAMAADLCLKESFYDTFMGLKGFFPDYLAYRLTERGKRGLKDTAKGGGFPRDFHYISGMQKVRKYVENSGNLSILYIGKIGLGDVDIAKELLDEGFLKPPKYLPDFI